MRRLGHTFDLVLIGAPGSGKRDLGQRLAQRLDVPLEAALVGEQTPQALEELWQREQARDRAAQALPKRRGARRVLVNWHIGHTALHALSAPREAARLRARLYDLLLRHDVPVVVQPLALGTELFAPPRGPRCQAVRPEDAAGRQLAWHLRRVALDAPVYTLPLLWPQALCLDQCAEQIAAKIDALSLVHYTEMTL